MKTDRAKPVFASPKQKQAMAMLMAANLEEIGHEEFRYINGYSDLKIASEVGCSPRSVEGHRRAAFGKLVGAPSGGAGSSRILELEKQFERLLEKHNALCRALSLNKVMDARNYVSEA